MAAKRPVMAKPLTRAILWILWKDPSYGGYVSKFTKQTFVPTILSEYIPDECFQEG
jgi:DNA-binding PadR family transcriptional regulator